MKVIKNNIAIIKDFISKVRNNKDIDDLLTGLGKVGSYYFVGGVIRDLYNNNKIRDIDIIYHLENEKNFDQQIIGENFDQVKINNLSGYKFSLSNITFDLWSFSDNWAFQKGFYEPNFHNIQYGTFYNFDSLVFGASEEKMYCELYNKAVMSNRLDIVDHRVKYIYNNPTPELNIVKALVYKYNHGFEFSKVLKEYIFDWKNTNCGSIKELKEEEKRHFGREVLDRETYRKLLEDEIS